MVVRDEWCVLVFAVLRRVEGLVQLFYFFVRFCYDFVRVCVQQLYLRYIRVSTLYAIRVVLNGVSVDGSNVDLYL